jgi:hypothetical protein
MTNTKIEAPIILTTNEEWYYIVAPRVAPEGQENTDAVLFNPPADIWDDMPTPMETIYLRARASASDDDMPTDDDMPIDDDMPTDDAPMTFNPITGEFE